jgi:hypothetical protein
MLPVLNHTDVPQAGLRAEAIVEGLVRAHGVNDLTRYPAVLNSDTLFEPTERKIMIEAEKWARIQKARYAIYGAVDEWRYKVGIDGEPAVGVALSHHRSRLEPGRVDRCGRQERLEPRSAFGRRAEADSRAAGDGAGSISRTGTVI